jgi:serine/threonine protein kinase
LTDVIDPELEGILQALETEEASGGIQQVEDPTHVIAGRYRILKELGVGGMGRVLLVRHERLGKQFALKLMQADFSQHPEAEQIFRREAQLASQLAHPNIVETVDFGHDPNWGWFIAMEYIEGEALSVHIEREHPVLVVCDIAVQLADGQLRPHARVGSRGADEDPAGDGRRRAPHRSYRAVGSTAELGNGLDEARHELALLADVGLNAVERDDVRPDRRGLDERTEVRRRVA